MNIKPFKLERYFAKYEFSAKYLLSSSDCDGLSQSELIKATDEEMKSVWKNLKLGYTESLGHPLLRSEVSKLYKGIGVENVIVFIPEEAIFAAMSTILEKGDHVICTYPGYQSLYQVAENMGCTVTKWIPDEKNGWKFDVEILKRSIKKNTKMIIVNFPHNPTGFLPSKAEFNTLIDIAKKHDVYLFSDEMYRFLEYKESERLPSASELYGKAISLFGMSKTFGMAGVRIGWLITKDLKLINNLASFKDYLSICSSAPSEILSIIALRAKEKIISSNLKKIKNNLELLDKFFERNSDKFLWVRPRAGTIGLPRLKNNISGFKFCQDVVEKVGVMLLPSTVYDFDDRHFRIGFGRQNMPEALNELEKYISTNYNYLVS
jgi:aspartate/methionine/tyrosine aminotransferase